MAIADGTGQGCHRTLQGTACSHPPTFALALFRVQGSADAFAMHSIAISWTQLKIFASITIVPIETSTSTCIVAQGARTTSMSGTDCISNTKRTRDATILPRVCSVTLAKCGFRGTSLCLFARTFSVSTAGYVIPRRTLVIALIPSPARGTFADWIARHCCTGSVTTAVGWAGDVTLHATKTSIACTGGWISGGRGHRRTGAMARTDRAGIRTGARNGTIQTGIGRRTRTRCTIGGTETVVVAGCGDIHRFVCKNFVLLRMHTGASRLAQILDIVSKTRSTLGLGCCIAAGLFLSHSQSVIHNRIGLTASHTTNVWIVVDANVPFPRSWTARFPICTGEQLMNVASQLTPNVHVLLAGCNTNDLTVTECFDTRIIIIVFMCRIHHQR